MPTKEQIIARACRPQVVDRVVWAPIEPDRQNVLALWNKRTPPPVGVLLDALRMIRDRATTACTGMWCAERAHRALEQYEENGGKG